MPRVYEPFNQSTLPNVAGDDTNQGYYADKIDCSRTGRQWHETFPQ